MHIFCLTETGQLAPVGSPHIAASLSPDGFTCLPLSSQWTKSDFLGFQSLWSIRPFSQQLETSWQELGLLNSGDIWYYLQYFFCNIFKVSAYPGASKMFWNLTAPKFAIPESTMRETLYPKYEVMNAFSILLFSLLFNNEHLQIASDIKFTGQLYNLSTKAALSGFSGFKKWIISN